MRGKPFTFGDFARGLNTKNAPYQLKDGEARDMVNMVATQRGAIRKRGGSEQLLGGDYLSLFAAFEPAVLIGQLAGALHRIAPNGTSTTIKTGLSTTARWEFTSAATSGGQGPIYGMNGVDTPQQHDGVAAAAANWTASAGAVPNGKYLVHHSNRVWVTGVASDPDAVFWSEIGDPRNWPAANVVRLDPKDGGAITGIGKVGPYVLVFKERKTWAIYNLDTGANRKLSDGVGCVGHRTIAEAPSGTLFLAQSGVFVTDGNRVDQVSEAVSPTLEELNVAQRRFAAGAYYNGHYYLSFARSSSDPDRTLDFDLELKSWWLHSLAARQWTVFEPASGLELLGAIPGGMVARRCFNPATPTDAGVIYPCFWASPFHAFGAPYLNKRLRQVHFDGSGRIEFEFATNFSPGNTLDQVVSLGQDVGFFGVNDGSLFGVNDNTLFGGQAASVSEARAYTLGVARAWSVIFGNRSAEPLEVDSYTMAITARKGGNQP